MKKIKLKHKKNIRAIDYILIVIFLLIISVFFVFRFIGKHITPIIQDYAEKQAKKISSIVISQAVTDEVIDYINQEEMFITTKDDSNNIQSVDFNSVNSPILLQYPPELFLIQNPTLICENFIQN